MFCFYVITKENINFIIFALTGFLEDIEIFSFGLCDRIDLSSEVKLSPYDMARNAMVRTLMQVVFF